MFVYVSQIVFLIGVLVFLNSHYLTLLKSVPG